MALAAAILANAVSTFLQVRSPDLAAILNPLNVEARVTALAAPLGRNDLDPQTLSQLERQARSLTKLSPGDARAWSLLGEVYRRQGRQKKADALFARALELAPTEINALLNRLRASLAGDRIDIAVDTLDIILRRWPKTTDAVKPVIDALAAHKDGSVLIKQKLAGDPPWRWPVIQRLAATGPGLALARQLLIEERAAGRKLASYELSFVINKLLALPDPQEAYRVFLLTLSADEKKHLGFVFNHDFKLAWDYRPFNWRAGKSNQADVYLPYRAGTRNAGGLALRFRGKPAKLGNIYQWLVLPPGHYSLRAQATARGLKAPKGLFWTIDCHDGPAAIARLAIEGENFRHRQFTTAFAVPDKNCPYQLLILKTDLIAPRWSQRYRGEVIFHDVSLTRQTPQGNGT